MRQRVITFLRTWRRILLFLVTILAGAAVIIGAIIAFFGWPWLLGAYLHGGLNNLLARQRTIPFLWLIIGYAWLLISFTGIIAFLKTRYGGNGDRPSEEDREKEREDIGKCPRCDAEIDYLIEKERNEAYDEAVRKCPECDAILAVVSTV